MNEPMHDLLTTAVDRRVIGLAHGRAFADGHHNRLLRAIRVRRIATRVGMGAAVAAVVAGAAYGIHAWAGELGNLEPGGHATVVHQDAVVTELVPLPLGNGEYDLSSIHTFYITLGATEMIPFPASGLWYPGIPDVPSDAILVTVQGDANGYDLTASDSRESDLQLFPAWDGESLDADHPWEMYDVLGEVTSTSRWGIRLYLVDGNVVTLAEGQANARAVEVIAWIGTEGPS